MSNQTHHMQDWTSTDLRLSSGGQLFDNAGVRRLRAAVEEDFAARQLASGGLRLFGAVAEAGGLDDLLGKHASALAEGQRLVLDMRSVAHWKAVSSDGSRLADVPAERGTAACDPADLAALASRHGLSLVALEPYGGLWDNAFLLASLPHPFKWLRLLSWLEMDDSLLRLALLLEQQVVARLDCQATGRYLVALEKSAPAEASPEWRLRQEQARQMRASDGLDGLQDVLQTSPEVFAAALESDSTRLRARHLLFILVRALRLARPAFQVEPWLPDATAAQLDAWFCAEAIDTRNMALVHGWVAPGAPERMRQGVDVVSGLEYHLSAALLRDYFKTHSGVSS